MKTVFDAMMPLFADSVTEKEKGTKFELACVFFLQNDPYWAARFSRVGTLEQALTWADCPVQDSRDIGIDLVAQERGTGNWWAIQCKCYATDAALPKGVCDSFFARVGADESISTHMVITSAKGAAPNLRRQLDAGLNSGKVFFIDLAKMAQSDLDWAPFIDGTGAKERETYDPRPHQVEAIAAITSTFSHHDRCKAIMACGTGKTLMSLRLTEQLLPAAGTVLFCAPSISLVSQSMREWMKQTRTSITPLVVCSDAKASKTKDQIPASLADFEYPATTNPETLAKSYARARAVNPDGLTVIFSTYQSIDVIGKAQALGVADFDLIICDEAHRTTGNALPGVSKKDASAFMKVHYQENVRGLKRLYMTATPRIYGEAAKRKGKEDDYTIASMDDTQLYGPTAYQIKFGEAVEKGLLTDYKVVVLTVQEDKLAQTVDAIGNEGLNQTLDASDIGKIIGCWKGLAEHGEQAPRDPYGLDEVLLVDDLGKPEIDATPLRRAVGFCSTIEASKTIADSFSRIVKAALASADSISDYQLETEVQHVDGSMSSLERSQKLAWLAEPIAENTNECRMLTNARCLAEGIDVPKLDAVIFFNAKNSIVDIVQAVGRVMRKAPFKNYGYIVLPVFVKSGMTPESALDDNATFANVWSVLQALRSHDERIEAKINALALEAQTQNYSMPSAQLNKTPFVAGGGGEHSAALSAPELYQEFVEQTLDLRYTSQFHQALRTVLVKKCGTRIYWDAWADDVARIAARHIERLTKLIDSSPAVTEKFSNLLTGLQDSLNPGVTKQAAIEMIAQHLITMPVFDALFGDFPFSKLNPVSIAINDFMTVVDEHLDKVSSDQEVLEDMYQSVRRRASMIKTDAARQKLIKDLYEEFFSKAFKGTSEKMGIVYTPNEVIDYILRATNRVLQQEFGRSLADAGVHILDPFAGTGSFIAHLLESDLIPDQQIVHKYQYELHSNEILLLAYYIMSVNIEYAYHARMTRAGQQAAYEPFNGAVLTDTFQMDEDGDAIDHKIFVKNSERMQQQRQLPIQVIVGNPPYSSGQKNANDNNQNDRYPTLDAKIERTYVRASEDVTNKNSLYDSYIRAFRWASDRIGKQGVVAFVTNAGWLRSQAGAGVRRTFLDEFDDIYVFDLRGNSNLQGEPRRKEGGNVFDQGSKTPVAITVLVKHDVDQHAGRIHYHDIGDYLKRSEKLEIIQQAALTGDLQWETLTMDKYGDWLDKRDDSFYDLMPLGLNKQKPPYGVFKIWSRGVATCRDAWAWNFSRAQLIDNMSGLIARTNSEIERVAGDTDNLEYDATKYSWSDGIKNLVKRQRIIDSDPMYIGTGLYRPYCKQFVWFDRDLNERTYQMTRIFPHPDLENLVIAVDAGYALMANYIPDLHYVGSGQCFPLYWYELQEDDGSLFDVNPNVVCAGGKRYIRHDAITDETLTVFREAYPQAFAGRSKIQGGDQITKDDIFYYIYGVLHSEEYRKRFGTALAKELPRIPLAESFTAFASAGRQLAALHINYEAVEPLPTLVEVGDQQNPGQTVKMNWGKVKKSAEHPKGEDRSILNVTDNLAIHYIPNLAHEYVVNGKTALEWLVDRYQIRTDKNTKIINDPNEYSEDPRYIVNLVKSVVAVSVRTMEIVRNLPKLNDLPQPANWPDHWRSH